MLIRFLKIDVFHFKLLYKKQYDNFILTEKTNKNTQDIKLRVESVIAVV